jgi:hypothetical protein
MFRALELHEASAKALSVGTSVEGNKVAIIAAAEA